MKNLIVFLFIAAISSISCRSGKKFSGEEDSLLMHNLVKEVQDSVRITMSQAADTMDTADTILIDSTTNNK